MRSVRLTRVLRELRLATGRTLAMVAAVAVGTIAVGTTLGAYGILSREISRSYRDTVPASATIELGEVTDDCCCSLRTAQPRLAWPPRDGEIFLEHRGLLERGRADVAAASARASAAEARASIPTFMFGGMYMQAPQMRPGLGLEFGMTLPWLWSGEPDLAAAARAEAAAAEAEVLGAERAIEVEVRTALAELETTAHVLETLRTREAPAAAFALDATAAAYGAGEGTLLEWLDAARAIRELEIEETEILSEILHALVGVASAGAVTLQELGREPLGAANGREDPTDP
jgi:hypothetical protein